MSRNMIALRRLAALTLLLSVSGCDRTPEAGARPSPIPNPIPVASTSTSTSTSASVGANAEAKGEKFRLKGSARVVAIGDIHGDLSALRAALRLGGAIDSDDRWIGKDLTVVQTGDQLDRGDQDREVLDVIEKLESDAKSAGGAFYVLNGNHELMNASLDFRYVTAKSFKSFGDFASRAGAASERLPDDERGRAAAFLPGAPYALKLSQHLTVAMVGDSLFAHGGVLPAHVDYGLDRINRDAQAFLAGKLPELPKSLSNEDSPVWTRTYGSPEIDEATCQTLARTLSLVGAKRLVVGHTVQKTGISSACQGRLFRIDVGLSAYYGDNPAEVLEITAQGARPLKAGAAATPGKKSKTSDSVLHSSP